MPIRGRRNRRFVVEDATVEYRKHSSLPFLGGSPKVSPLINLSIGGLQFVSDDFFSPGVRLDLKVMIPAAFRSLTVRGEVVWAKRVVDRDHYRTGVRYIDPSTDDIGLLRSLEEQYWAIADERKQEMESLIAERYPLHRTKPPAEVAASQAAEARAQARPPADAPPPEAPPEGQAPAPAEPPPEPGQPQPESAPAAPLLIPLYDLVAGVESRRDEPGFAIQGMPKAQVALPNVIDADCFALEIHDHTRRYTGTPSFDRGNVVVFSPNVPARSGDLAFVVTRDGGIFRQIFFDANNVVRLRPLNSWYPEQCFHRGEVQGLWKLIGKYESYLST